MELNSDGSRVKKVAEYRRKEVKKSTIGGLTAEEEQVFIAISFGKVHRLTSLLPQLDYVDIRGPESRTPLIHTTVYTRGVLCSHLLKLLLKHGSDVNAKDEYGRTALMYACQHSDNADAVRVLVRSRHCDLNIQDENGDTALMISVLHGQVDALRLILFFHHPDIKTDLNMCNKAGKTALSMAVSAGQAECCKVLVKEAQADTSYVVDKDEMNTLLRT